MQSYTTAATDAMNHQIVTGSTGTSISITFIEVYGKATPAAAAIGPKYQHFDNTPRWILGRQNYNPFGGGQMVIFGELVSLDSTRLSSIWAFWGCDANSYTYDIKDKLETLSWGSTARFHSGQYICSS